MTHRTAADAGRVHLLVAVLTLAVLAVAGASIDGGLALAAKTRAYSQAADAARTGAAQINLPHYRQTGQAIIDPAAAHTAAHQRLAQTGTTGRVTATTTQVAVTVEHTQPTQLWRLIGIASLTVAATATAQIRHGITTPAGLPEGSVEGLVPA
jgi:Flp pilus assembly protein TadG